MIFIFLQLIFHFKKYQNFEMEIIIFNLLIINLLNSLSLYLIHVIFTIIFHSINRIIVCDTI